MNGKKAAISGCSNEEMRFISSQNLSSLFISFAWLKFSVDRIKG